MSVYNIARFNEWNPNQVIGIGKIELNENCFIGAYSILMPNSSAGKIRSLQQEV